MATIDEIKQQAAAVKNATQVGENTAERVGGALSGLAEIAKAQEDNIGKKADKAAMDTALGKKADKAAVNASLDLKANKSDVAKTNAVQDAEISRKANKQDVECALNILRKEIGERTIVEGDVNNNPDEEDLTSKMGSNNREVLSLKDREYNPLEFSGKGYKILRKNLQKVTCAITKIQVTKAPTTDGYVSIIINGVETHVNLVSSTDNTVALVAKKIADKLSETMDEYVTSVDGALVTCTRRFGGDVTASSFSGVSTGSDATVSESSKTELRNLLTTVMLNQSNCIYEIRYDFDLDGKTLEVPENCTLKFEGGSLENGEINCNNSNIQSIPYNIFRNIKLTGFIYNVEYPVEWFGASKDLDDNSPIINFMINMLSKLKSGKFTIILSFLYKIKSTIILKNGISIVGKGIYDYTDWNGVNNNTNYSGFYASFDKTDCAILDYTDQTTLPIFDDYNGTKYNFTGSIFKNFTILADKDKDAINCGIRLRWFFAGEISNIRIIHTNIGIALNWSWNFTIRNCKIRSTAIGLYLYQVTQCVINNVYLFKENKDFFDKNLNRYIVTQDILPDYIENIRDVAVICDKSSMSCIDLIAQSFYNCLFQFKGVVQIITLYFELNRNSFEDLAIQTMVSAKNNAYTYINRSIVRNYVTENYTFSARGKSVICAGGFTMATCDPTDKTSAYRLESSLDDNVFYYDDYKLDDNCNPIETTIANKEYIRFNNWLFATEPRNSYEHDAFNNKLLTGFSLNCPTTINEIFKRQDDRYNNSVVFQAGISTKMFSDINYIVSNKKLTFDVSSNFKCAQNWQIDKPIMCENCTFIFTKQMYLYNEYSFDVYGNFTLAYDSRWYIGVPENNKRLVRISKDNVVVNIYTSEKKTKINDICIIKEGVTKYVINLYSDNKTLIEKIDTINVESSNFARLGSIFKIKLSDKNAFYQVFYLNGTRMENFSFRAFIYNDDIFINPDFTFPENSIELYKNPSSNKEIYIKCLHNDESICFVLSDNKRTPYQNLSEIPTSYEKIPVLNMRKGGSGNRPSYVEVGFIYKNTDTGKLEIFNGSSWENLDGTQITDVAQ